MRYAVHDLNRTSEWREEVADWLAEKDEEERVLSAASSASAERTAFSARRAAWIAAIAAIIAAILTAISIAISYLAWTRPIH